MLLNFTNHPYDNWTEKQKEEAIRLYGNVVDLPFPNIPPEATEEDIKQLAEEYLQKIIDLNPTAVHIQGEFTFTNRMVKLLTDAGITCIASTTNRIVVENPDGTRTYKFEFVRFREYI